ncbi:MAG: dipeptidase [Paraglaciecola sp.]|uniref:dipeptidase n=1 Tax=Paraglaciecola sp. TaxID=1920173 RepID=UPI00273F1D2C|nr:dipeptidase [Paraglaciecola sp.]MDP5029180.1 dipeptidase [Paraglaciecola sp.]MDP5129367.1 dipeptidase [Paraglaciecola sp.]
MNILLKAGLLIITGLVNAVYATASPANLNPKMSTQIIANTRLQTSDTFDDFLTQVLTLHTINQHESLGLAINKYRAKETLNEGQLHQLQRLLGLYTRIKHGQDAIETLAQLVAIPTFRVEGVAQHDNPQFYLMADAIAAIAKKFNLAFRNIDNRVFEVSLKGSSDEVVGIHAHADVVPVTPSLWVLEDGTQLDPFKLTLIGDRMYGRGAEDDKNGIVVTMYAMKVIQEENIPLLRHFHLLIDTTEETSSDAIPYYFARNPTPNYNLALDGGYPVVIAEKGSGGVMATFPVRAGQANSKASAEIVAITGGLAMNQIPGASVAQINSADAASLMTQLHKLASQFIQANGGNFTITASKASYGVELTVKGISAHSSEPESGVNPVSRMLAFIAFAQQQTPMFSSNHITDAASYVAANWGISYLGQNLGIGFADDFMGPLTHSVTLINLNETSLQVGVNLRVPVGREVDDIKQDILAKLALWKQKSGINVELSAGIRAPMYRNPEGYWVNALLDVATENLAMPRVFGSSNGGTSVHNLPNGVQFGLAMPNEKYTGHNANEFKRVEQFLLDLQIITEMIARVGQIPQL